jgi:hypothetical protein
MRRFVSGSSLAAGVTIVILLGVFGSTGAVAQTSLCGFWTRGDNAHISSTAFEASAHGWWINVNCNAQVAVVTVELQQQYSDRGWRAIGTVGRSTVKSGGGAGNRATARARCVSRDRTQWRSVVDVDVIGVADDPRKYKTPVRTLSCRA